MRLGVLPHLIKGPKAEGTGVRWRNMECALKMCWFTNAHPSPERYEHHNEMTYTLEDASESELVLLVFQWCTKERTQTAL